MFLFFIFILFYNKLHYLTKFVVNNLDGGFSINKTIEESFMLLEELAFNSYNWVTNRQLEKPGDVFELEASNSLMSNVDVLSY